MAVTVAQAQTDVLASRGDNARTGQNLTEPALTAQTVGVGTFGKLYSFPVDGYTYAQPLVKASLAIAGKGTFNVVFVATEHGSVYALDADSATPIWHQTFINPASGLTPRAADTGSDIIPEISITSTPVIDPVGGTLYVVAEVQQSGSPAYYYLHALDISTGADKVAPVRIQASAGVAPPLNPAGSQQRPGLVLSNGIVFVGFGSSSDSLPWVGWLLGYNAATLAQVSVLCLSGDGASGAGLWGPGSAPPVDSAGNLYLITGNGRFNASNDWGNAILKVNPAGTSVLDYFAPFNQAALGSADDDLASAGITLLPDSAGSTTHPHLLLGSGKDGEVYLLDRDSLGHYNPAVQNTQIVQWLPNAVGGTNVAVAASPMAYVENSYTTPAYWQNRVYFCGVNDNCNLFALSAAHMGTTPASSSAVTFAYPGGQPVISAASSAATSAIMWVVQRDVAGNTSILRAYDATNLANELYDSNQAAGGRDTGGPPVKFAVPTVANGKVFVGTQSELDVYGLLSSRPPRLTLPVFSPVPAGYASAQSVSISANAGATIYYTLDGSLPTLASPVYAGPITVSTTTTISAMAVQGGYLTSPVASATYTIGTPVTPVYVQGNSSDPQSTALGSVAVPFPAAQHQGNLNVVVVGWNDTTAAVSSVTDSSGNVYQLAVGPTVATGSGTQSIYYSANIASAAAGANTVTVNFTRAASYPDIRILEYSGLATVNPVDATAAATGYGTAPSSGAAATTNANDLIFGADLTGGSTTAPGAGFTSRLVTSPDGDNAEDKLVSTAGSYAASAVTTSRFWIMQMVAFKAATVSSAPSPTPTAPAGLTAGAIASYEIDLSWSAASETGGTVAQYIVERCPGAGCSNFGQVGTSATTSYRDLDTSSPLSPSTSYSYRVRAQDAVGITGPYSNTASATTAAANSITAPGSLTGTAPAPTQVSLTWSASTEPGATIARYLIERRTGLGRVAFAQIATTTALNFSDNAVSAGGTYGYQVRAQDTAGNIGPFSSIATVTTPTALPTAPTNLAASAASGTQINLSWGAASETGGTVAGYLVERCPGSGCSTFAQVGTASDTSYSDTGLAASTSYSYRVRARDASGYTGPYSNTAGATTLAPAATGQPPTFVQQAYADPQSPASSVAVRLAGAQQTGDLNIVAVGWNDTAATVSTIGDSSGNVYQLAVGPTVNAGMGTQAIYYAANIAAAAAGANTVTVTFSTATASPDIRVLEYAGLATSAAVDVTAAATGNGTLASSGAATTGNANDLIFGAVLTQGHATGAGAGFTSRVITYPDGDDAEDRLVSAAGSYSATVPTTSAPWIMQMVAFKVSAAASSPPMPTAPGNLQAVAVDATHMNLSWAAATESGGTIAQYLVERCQGAGCSSFTQIGTASGTSYGDAGLTASTSYSYRVRAADATSNTGPYSNTASATTPAPSAQPIVFVQQAYAVPQSASQTSVGVPIPGAQKPGDLNVVVVGWNDTTATGPTVTDSSGNVYQLAAGPTVYPGWGTQAIYYATNIMGAAAGANMVTVAFNSTVGYPDVRVLEYSGVAATGAVDVTAAATGNGTLASSGAATTTNANDLIFGAALTQGHATGAGTGFTSRVITSPDGDDAEDRVVTAAGSYAATVPTTSAPWIMQMVAFRAAVVGASAPPPLAFVQQSYATPQSTSQASVAVRLGGAQQPGDLNVVAVGWNDSTATVATVSDSSGNTYQLAAAPTVYPGVGTQAIYYATSIAAAAAGANTVTVTFSRGASYPDVRVLEYSGLAATSAVDVTVAATGNGTLASSGPLTTSNATDLLFGAVLTQGHATGAGAGFASRVITSPNGDDAEDRGVGLTGSYTATVPTTSAPWIMQLVAFKLHP